MTGDTVKAGDTVRVDYLGTLRDGTVFDTSMESKAREAGLFNPQRAYEPIEFVVGAGQMIQGFDEAVVGMKSGEKKTVTLPPEKAYGERSEDLMQEVPTEDLKLSGIKPEEGTQLMTSAGPARVTSTNEDVTVLDFNHELAGETLIFEITLVSKE
ncbi:MAG: peptidylprolyl isomerase [Candidatus Diapherotrites archaeon]|nr:peptidylprolyl isomerase [Candidatus Diapherotrites archaeon]